MKKKLSFLILPILIPVFLAACNPEEHSVSSSLSSDSISSSLSSSSSSSFPASSSVPSSPSSSSSIMDPSTLYGGYYSSLKNWDNGEDLMAKLHDIISSGTYSPIQYNGSYTNWMSNQQADVDIHDREFLDCLYTGEKTDPSKTNISWQREHAWPASLLTGKGTGDAVKTLGRATDFHNLFAASVTGNTSRGNKNYGNADKTSIHFADRDFANGGYRYDDMNFEPADSDKGRVSRAIFYMATMYSEDEYDDSGSLLYKGLTVQEEYVTYSGSVPYEAYAIGNLSTLLDWSKNAVDLLEYQHNQSVYSYIPITHSTSSSNVAQGNRNPYIDFPGLVDYAFGSKKNLSGSLSNLVSSYQSLEIGEPSNNVRTILSAKRTYDVGSTFSKSDLQVGKYGPDMSLLPETSFTLEGVTDGETFNDVCVKTVKVITANNVLTYDIEINNSDPFVSGTYHYTLTGKASGGDLSGITSKPGVDNEVDLGGVTWIIRYEKGNIANKNANLGVAFGTSSSPVETLTIRSKGPFTFSGKSLVEGIYLKGSAASGCSYACSLYVGGEFIKQAQLGYTSGVAQEIGASISPKEGEVKFVISNVTKAVYIHSLAVNLK